ncbi:putative protein phosphatase 2C 55 [Apostasia shenzhenica]|uniref:protein-serine/threonine phosphatase n=1 Tax=Apostasia shenzhenica TaxID=1088818 RepID=A0A2H9ZQN9_9ASPA|nr:putative protein phosphatase 2C 55 [Apostasia shenzhenica]
MLVFRYPEDLVDRIWHVDREEADFGRRNNLESFNISLRGCNTSVPLKVLQSATDDNKQLVFLHEGLANDQEEFLIILHFLELDGNVHTGERVFDVYVNGDKMHEKFDILEDEKSSNYRVFSVRVKSGGYLNVSLVNALDAAKYGPICNAYEIYRVLQKGVETIERDVDAVMKLRDELMVENSKLEIFRNWCGDPCSPTSWAGLTCEDHNDSGFLDRSIHHPIKSPDVKTYTLEYIKKATSCYQTLIGEGGFGAVYRGTLPHGQEVAVKVRSATSVQGTREFDNEVIGQVNLLSKLHHDNLVPLLGYCCENDQQILVYPFMSNGSLQDRIYEVHIMGTRNVLILELNMMFICCQDIVLKRELSSSRTQFVAKPFIREQRIDEMVDPQIKGSYHAEAMWRVVEAALSCIEPFSAYRPSMADIVRELEDALIIENNASEYMRSIESFGGSNRFHSIDRKIPGLALTPSEQSSGFCQIITGPQPSTYTLLLTEVETSELQSPPPYKSKIIIPTKRLGAPERSLYVVHVFLGSQRLCHPFNCQYFRLSRFSASFEFSVFLFPSAPRRCPSQTLTILRLLSRQPPGFGLAFAESWSLVDQSLKLLSGSCYLPHPDKEDTGGEDSHFVCDNERIIGVADGVGGWANVGINAGEYARELMLNSVSAIKDEPRGLVDPAKVLEKAYLNTKAKGSSTACIIALTDQVLLRTQTCDLLVKGGIRAVNLGDSGFIAVRCGSTIIRSPVQQHDFNFAYQLESGNSRDLPCSAQVFSFPVESGDVIVAGTDGLFDNLYNDEIKRILVRASRVRLGPEVAAHQIAALARQRAQDKDRQTPFSAAAQHAGLLYHGGKLDDITVVLAISSFTSLQTLQKRRRPDSETLEIPTVMENGLIAVFLLLSSPLLCASFSADNPTSRRLLVLVDDLALRSSHSIFFNSLQSQGYDLEFRMADDPKLSLQRYGRYLYDGLVLFSPTVQRFGGSLDQAAVLEFVDAGHDLILAADSSASDLIKGIATECGVDFDEAS